MRFKYITEDGHEMKEGEIMWRTCNSYGDRFSAPAKVNFTHGTNYNFVETIRVNLHGNGLIISGYSDESKNPFHPNHKHYFDYNEALKNL